MALYINGQLQTMMPASSISNIRYVEADDVVQLYYDGQWRDWKSGGMAYPIGTVLNFGYTGDVQSLTVPASGRWKLEVWGAASNSGGKGGYAYGEAMLEIDQLLKIVVGGQSSRYNGGGSGSGGYGGGATHIAKDENDTAHTTLASYGNESVASNYVYVVGGGGGGSASGTPYAGGGGAGGGLTGSGGATANANPFYSTGGGGGTQSAGGGGGTTNGSGNNYGLSNGVAGTFGIGGNGVGTSGAGGGGWYGGGSGATFGSTQVGGWCSGGGGGGSSWYGGCLSGTTGTTAGSQSGNGKASLTYLGRL